MGAQAAFFIGARTRANRSRHRAQFRSPSAGEDLFEHGDDFDLRTSASTKKASD